MFTKEQQERLKVAASRVEKLGIEVVDAEIKRIRAESPEKFHDAESVKHRVFLDQPKPDHNVPHASWLVAFGTRV